MVITANGLGLGEQRKEIGSSATSTQMVGDELSITHFINNKQKLNNTEKIVIVTCKDMELFLFILFIP